MGWLRDPHEDAEIILGVILSATRAQLRKDGWDLSPNEQQKFLGEARGLARQLCGEARTKLKDIADPGTPQELLETDPSLLQPQDWVELGTLPSVAKELVKAFRKGETPSEQIERETRYKKLTGFWRRMGIS